MFTKIGEGRGVGGEKRTADKARPSGKDGARWERTKHAGMLFRKTIVHGGIAERVKKGRERRKVNLWVGTNFTAWEGKSPGGQGNVNNMRLNKRGPPLVEEKEARWV